MIKRIFREYPAAAIAFILFTVAFVLSYAVNASSVIEADFLLSLVFAVPAAVFALLLLCFVKRKTKKNTAFAVSMIAALIGIAFLAFSFMLVNIAEAVRTVTDISLYDRARTMSGYAYKVKKDEDAYIFPEELPDSVKRSPDTVFEYTPQFLQGAELLTLGYKTSADEFAKIERELSKKASGVFRGDENVICGKAGLSLYYPEKYAGEKEKFSAYVFLAEPYTEDSFNHGTAVYALLCREDGVVIYVYENF